MQTRAKLRAAVCVVALVGGVVSAADPSVDALIRDILHGAKTHAQRAARLYEAAKTLQSNKKAQVRFLERAVDYGLKAVATAAGQEAAEKSLDLLLEAAPERKDEWARKRLELYRRAFKRMTQKTLRKRALAEKLVAMLLEVGAAEETAGKWQQAAGLYREARFPAHTMNLFIKDEVSRRFTRATHFAIARVKAAGKGRALRRDPQDLAARVALIEALVIQLDDPAEAAKYLTDDVDERRRTYVRLAAKDVSELKGAAGRELGDWYYRALLRKAPSLSQDRMLYRAKACYEQFLKSGPSKDAAAAVGVVLAQINRELYKREAYKRWINLLSYVDESAALTQGSWKLTPDGPRVFAPAKLPAVIPVPVTPEGNYEVEVAFIRHSWGKPDSVHVTCPVGTAASVNVILDGYGKHIGGFENIRGAGGTTIRENGTAVACRVSNEREYNVQITVEVEEKNAKIVVKLRGSPLMEWTGPLTSVVSVTDPPATFGLGAGWNTSITYTTAKLRMLSGEAKLPE